jgi:predicted Zn-dependent protease
MSLLRRPVFAALVAAAALWTRPAVASTIELIGLGWSGSDIRYRIEPSTDATAVLTDIQSAINDWNAALSAVAGAPQFVAAPPGLQNPDVTLSVGGDAGRTLGSTSLSSQSDCAIASVTVEIYDESEGGDFTAAGLRTVIRHELGHVLGLGHSDDPADLMFASTDPWSDSDRLIGSCHTLALAAIYPFQARCGAVPHTIRCQLSLARH